MIQPNEPQSPHYRLWITGIAELARIAGKLVRLRRIISRRRRGDDLGPAAVPAPPPRDPDRGGGGAAVAIELEMER